MKYLFILLSLFANLVLADEYKVVKLRWEPIEGAKSYVVQVSDSNTFENILYETKTKDTRIEFDYDPSYKFARFAGIDQNGILGEFSDSVSVETRLTTAKRGGSNLYVSVSYVNWTSGAIDNFVKIPNYPLINNLFLSNILFPNSGGFNYTFNGSLSNKLRGRSVELGGEFSSKSGTWKNRIAIRNVSARPENGYTLELFGVNDNLEFHSFNPLQMYLVRYNLKYLPFLSSSNPLLKGLGFQAGLNSQRENFYASMIYFSLTSTVGNEQGILPQKNKYQNQTNYINIGFDLNYEFNKTHELNLGLSYLLGKSNGNNEYNYWIPFPLLFPTSSRTSFVANVSGLDLNLGYTYHINSKHGVRVNFENRTLNYTITESKTTNKLGLNLPMNNLGVNSTLSDNLQLLSFEYFYKF